MDNKDYIVKVITDFYLNSGDFNGFPVRNILLEKSELKDILASLIREDKISLTFEDIDVNPHVKNFPEGPSEKQIEKLQNSELEHNCAYPSCSHLKKVVDPLDYQGKPFTLRLALGEAALSYESFDLSVLEDYRNDPRYYYSNTDIYGQIRVGDKHDGSAGMLRSDEIFLKTFGFSYDSDLNRAVAVFLIYLSRLSPEHQQMWNAKIVKGDYQLHPDYYRTSILGRFQEGISIFDAFISELQCINEMCGLMGRSLLFKKSVKPRDFGFLIRPTLKEYYDFIHTLDKLLSENINKEFFRKDVPFEQDKGRKDGKIVVRQKGTIQILDDWLKLVYRTNDRKSIEEIIDTFKEIRELRQHPAHVIDDNVFNQICFKQQRELIIKAYKNIRLLRLIFADHPNVAGYEIPDHLQSGKIWDI